MFEIMTGGAAQRVVEAAAQATPTLLTGLLVAGVFRYFLGPANTRRLFGGDTWRSLPQAWLLGMLLPVCSIGVIPCVREMRRAGLSGGTILAFALAAPLFNPLSILYGLTLSKPFVIFTFALCSLAIVTVVGFAFDRVFPRTEAVPPPEPQVQYGIKRLLAVLVVSARELAGPTGGYALVALLGVAILSASLPHGALQHSMNGDNPLAPLVMSAVAIPAFVTPMTAMSQLGSMFQHGNSVGAAFALLAFGAGTNLGLIGWMYRTYGARRASSWLAMLFAVVILLAYGVDRPLRSADVEPADHTHAFDVYTNPFTAGQDHVWEHVGANLNRLVLPHDRIALGVVATILLLGALLNLLDARLRLESWLEGKQEPRSEAASGAWGDLIVPLPVLGGVMLVGLVAFSVVGCFAYYPAQEEVFEEMSIVKAEALSAASAGHVKVAEHWIAVWDDWTRKLQVGVYLRTGKLSEYQRMKARILRDKLELLEHEVGDGDEEATRRLIAEVSEASRRLKTAYSRGA